MIKALMTWVLWQVGRLLIALVAMSALASTGCTLLLDRSDSAVTPDADSSPDADEALPDADADEALPDADDGSAEALDAPDDSGEPDAPVADADRLPDGDVECLDSSSCPDDAFGCTVSVCEDFECGLVADHDRCDSDELCVLIAGCVPLRYVDEACEGACGLGTKAAPYESLSQAFDDATSRDDLTVLRVAGGDYVEPAVEVKGSTTIVVAGLGDGVRWSTGEATALKVHEEAQVTLRQVTVTSTKRVVLVEGSGVVALDRSTLEGASDQCAFIKGAGILRAERSLFTDCGKAAIAVEDTARLTALSSFVILNKASEGAIRLEEDVTLSMINCTVSDNGRGVVSDAPLPEGAILNTIFWSNGGEDCDECVLGTDSLNGSLSPHFVETPRDSVEDYRLRPTSPAIDNGVWDVGVPELDYFGESRLGTVDTGAAEYVTPGF